MWKGGVAMVVFDRRPGCLQTNLISLRMSNRMQILGPSTQTRSGRIQDRILTLEQGMIRGQGCKDCPSVATHYSMW
jgi:hypothetical protein